MKLSLTCIKCCLYQNWPRTYFQVIWKWICVLYSDVESAVLNRGYLTNNYFKVSRGIWQGCPLCPLLLSCFRCRGNGPKTKAKISQFKDDTTLIWGDLKALKENMNFIKKHNLITWGKYESNVDWFSQK